MGIPDKSQINKFHAIETYHRGFKFRSRLEARWYIFFESLGIEAHYESEGWKLEDGTYYLPDFFLPQINNWAEVKPIPFSNIERRKAEMVCRGSGQTVLLLVGPPDFRDYEGISWDAGDFTNCQYRLDIDQHNRQYYLDERRLFSSPMDELTDVFCSNRYRRAVYDSRSARFENWPPPAGKEPFNLTEEEMGGIA